MSHLWRITYTTLLILLSSVFCQAACPCDTVALWAGHKIHYGNEVTMYVFRPDVPNGSAVIVCPGGSYHWLDHTGEGLKVGEWLSSNGITAFVLFYRTAGAAEFVWHTRIIFRGKRHPDMITDAQRALQYVWECAEYYSVDRDKIGIMGFSAGGHLAMTTACFNSSNFLEKSGIDTEANLRPSYVAAIYPVVTMQGPYVHKRSRRGLLGDSRLGNNRLKDLLSIEKHIPENCPPVFIINCKDDPVVMYQNSEMLDSALTVKGIPHKYIQYKEGKHGFGVSDFFGSPECREWKNEFLRWLNSLYDTSK